MGQAPGRNSEETDSVTNRGTGLLLRPSLSIKMIEHDHPCPDDAYVCGRPARIIKMVLTDTDHLNWYLSSNKEG
jgi:hypothetical protein